MSVAVTTRSYDNTRAGANIQESVLTPEALRRRGLKRLLTLSLPGDLRGCEAQPLVAPGVLRLHRADLPCRPAPRPSRIPLYPSG